MQIIDFHNLSFSRKKKQKDGFSIYDFGKSEFELLQEFQDDEDEVPDFSSRVIKRGLAKGIDLATLDILKSAEIVDKKFDRVIDGTIRMQRSDVDITGNIDAITIKNSEFGFDAGIPICIRSVFDKSHFDNKFIKYFGQLAMMMDYKESDHGMLIISTADDITMYWAEKIDGKFHCRNEIIDLQNQYATFAKVKSQK